MAAVGAQVGKEEVVGVVVVTAGGAEETAGSGVERVEVVAAEETVAVAVTVTERAGRAEVTVAVEMVVAAREAGVARVVSVVVEGV